MNIAGYDIYSIETSRFGLDGGAMFGIIPKPLWEKKAPADDKNRIEMVTRSLLLVGHGRMVLVDTGNGDKWSHKLKSIYNINTQSVNIKSSLKKYGFSPEEITDIICTHLHFDHIGGNTVYRNEIIEPSFPHAKVWIQKDNWDLANSPSEKDQGSFIATDWEILAENGMIDLVTGREAFLPNIDIELTYGHTTGMMHPIIRGTNQTLFYGADLFPMAAHIPLPWVMAYDIQPVVTIQEKRKLLPKMVDEEWILFFEHDPKHQAGIVGYDGKHYFMKTAVNISE